MRIPFAKYIKRKPEEVKPLLKLATFNGNAVWVAVIPTYGCTDWAAVKAKAMAQTWNAQQKRYRYREVCQALVSKHPRSYDWFHMHDMVATVIKNKEHFPFDLYAYCWERQSSLHAIGGRNMHMLIGDIERIANKYLKEYQ